MDLVFPGNEQELAAMAGVLGLKDVVFIYPVGKASGKDNCAVVCGPKEYDAALKTGLPIVLRSSEADRAICERKNPPQYILGLGEVGKDRFNERDTGLDRPLLRILAKKGIAVVLSLASVLETEGEGRAVLLGRYMEIVSLCRRAGVDVVMASCASDPYGMRAPHDLQSLGVVLGMNGS